MKNQSQQLYGLILICVGIALLIVVGGPMLITMLALILGLYMIHYGLLLRGNPSLLMLVQKVFEDIRTRFFNR